MDDDKRQGEAPLEPKMPVYMTTVGLYRSIYPGDVSSFWEVVLRPKYMIEPRNPKNVVPDAVRWTYAYKVVKQSGFLIRVVLSGPTRVGFASGTILIVRFHVRIWALCALARAHIAQIPSSSLPQPHQLTLTASDSPTPFQHVRARVCSIV